MFEYTRITRGCGGLGVWPAARDGCLDWILRALVYSWSRVYGLLVESNNDIGYVACIAITTFKEARRQKNGMTAKAWQ
jgi:hypothetical protein